MVNVANVRRLGYVRLGYAWVVYYFRVLLIDFTCGGLGDFTNYILRDYISIMPFIHCHLYVNITVIVVYRRACNAAVLSLFAYSRGKFHKLRVCHC
jgi:hypothetical protein